MAVTYGDRVQETFTTTGTGTISLGGAVTGYQAFSAVVANAGTCYYAATDGTNWEVGLGTYATSGNTLARTTILASSNSGSAVSWSSGTKNIWLDLPAARLAQPTAPTQSAGDNSTNVATTAYVDGNAVGGANQAWTDVTASRSGVNVYTNSTGRPIMVMIDLAISPNSTAGFYIAGTQFTQAGNGTNSAVIRTVTSFIVPAGATYELTTVSGSLTLGQWSELR